MSLGTIASHDARLGLNGRGLPVDRVQAGGVVADRGAEAAGVSDRTARTWSGRHGQCAREAHHSCGHHLGRR